MTTFLIFTRSGSSFSVTSVEVDPKTSQGVQALQDKINQLSASGNIVFQITKV